MGKLIMGITTFVLLGIGLAMMALNLSWSYGIVDSVTNVPVLLFRRDGFPEGEFGDFLYQNAGPAPWMVIVVGVLVGWWGVRRRREG